MINFLGEHWKYFIGAVLVHLLIAGIVALTAISTSHRTPPPMLAIQAVVVDRSLLEAPARRERARQQAAERRRQEQERQKKEQEEERQKQQTEEKAQREAEQVKQAEMQRQAEQRKQEEQAAERTRQAEVERKQRADAERQKKEQADRDRIADIQRRQREAEERRRAEAERRSQELREGDLQRQLAEEEGREQAANAGLLNQYIALLQQQVIRNWNRPPSARSGIQCKVTVNQAPGGTVLNVAIGECNGDQAVRQSIESAVYRSSPLPPPPDQRLFERTLIFWFKPAD
ncbi:MAG: cell envelope integrity protein TolA [Steroidobacteraceae bacterium]